jgi:hypothetical protein
MIVMGETQTECVAATDGFVLESRRKGVRLTLPHPADKAFKRALRSLDAVLSAKVDDRSLSFYIRRNPNHTFEQLAAAISPLVKPLEIRRAGRTSYTPNYRLVHWNGEGSNEYAIHLQRPADDQLIADLEKDPAIHLVKNFPDELRVYFKRHSAFKQAEVFVNVRFYAEQFQARA